MFKLQATKYARVASYIIAKWPLKEEVSATFRASHPPRGDNCWLWLVASYCRILLNMTCGPLLRDWCSEHSEKKKKSQQKWVSKKEKSQEELVKWEQPQTQRWAQKMSI